MRTIILTLAVVLLAAPAWAVVYITATDLGEGVVSIDYNSVGESNLPRAFALDIFVDEGNIVDINNYAVGDDNNGFGIFPGSFGVLYVDPDKGTVESWEVGGYTPVADGSHPTALGGLDTNGITIEMGSLYDTNAPYSSGQLCTVTVSSNPAYLSVRPNMLSGGVVMEDANGPLGDVDVTGATKVEVDLGDECFPSDKPGYDLWVANGKPLCWCYKNQCYGDADGKMTGGAWTGFWHVGTADLTTLVNSWQVLEPTPPGETWPGGPGIASIPNGICADFAHDLTGGAWTGFWHVGTSDLTLLVNSWQVLEPTPPGETWPGGPGLAGDCVPVPVEPEP